MLPSNQDKKWAAGFAVASPQLRPCEKFIENQKDNHQDNDKDLTQTQLKPLEKWI